MATLQAFHIFPDSELSTSAATVLDLLLRRGTLSLHTQVAVRGHKGTDGVPSLYGHGIYLGNFVDRSLWSVEPAGVWLDQHWQVSHAFPCRLNARRAPRLHPLV